MKLLTFSVTSGRPRLGVLIGDNKVLDVALAYHIVLGSPPPRILASMKELIAGGERGLKLVSYVLEASLEELGSGSKLSKLLEDRAIHSIESIRFHPPIPNPEKMLFVAVNYWSHAKELNLEPPETPYFFVKLPNTLVAHRDPVIIPRGSLKPDHEVELAVVIGREGKYVSRGKALDHVFGYTIANDVSLRDRQQPIPRYGIRWVHAKSFDTGAPLGPWIVTRDEVEDPHNLRLELRVNGEVRQEGSTSDMIFKIPELIEAASDGLTLKPGDVISTGTPSGVGAATGRFLRHGDVMMAVVERIGALTNPVVFES